MGIEQLEAQSTGSRSKKGKSVKANMEYVASQEGKGCSYVAFFPSRYNPLKGGEENEETCPTKFEAFKNPKQLSRQQELVAWTNDGVDFVGANYVGEAAGWQPCNYLLAVYDKAKGSLKLAPLAGEKVFRMEPRVRGFDYGRTTEEAEEVKSTPEMQKLRKRMLTEAFGSKRSRSKAARYERGVIKEDAIVDLKENMKQYFKEAAENELILTTEQALEQVNTAMVRNIPPHDVIANTPQAAYPLEKIISTDEWESMDVADLQRAAKYTRSEVQALREEKTYPEYVLNRLKRASVEGDKAGSDRRAHVLMYIKHLLAFHHASYSTLRKLADPWGSSGGSASAEDVKIPGPLVMKFLKIFAKKTGDGVRRNKEHGELLVSYVLVLGLMVDDYRADPYDLANDLRMTVSQLRPHYEQLGCSIETLKGAERKAEAASDASAKGRYRVILPVPLKFPEIKRVKARSVRR